MDPNLWKLELERVAPKLRILLNADAKDWRSHLEEVHDHSKVPVCGVPVGCASDCLEGVQVPV